LPVGVFALQIDDNSMLPIQPGTIATFERVHRIDYIKFGTPIYIRLTDGVVAFFML